MKNFFSGSPFSKKGGRGPPPRAFVRSCCASFAATRGGKGDGVTAGVTHFFLPPSLSFQARSTQVVRTCIHLYVYTSVRVYICMCLFMGDYDSSPTDSVAPITSSGGGFTKMIAKPALYDPPVCTVKTRAGKMSTFRTHPVFWRIGCLAYPPDEPFMSIAAITPHIPCCIYMQYTCECSSAQCSCEAVVLLQASA